MTKPIHVLLDTNVYRKEQLTSRFISSFRERTLAGEFILHVPWFVHHEVAGRLQSPVLRARKTAQKIEGILQERPAVALPPDSHDLLKAFVEALDRAPDGDATFRQWLSGACVTPEDLVVADLVAAVDGYFAGEPPYKEPRDKHNFPDAVVFHSALRVAQHVGKLYVVVEDDNLRRTLDAASDAIITTANLGEFLLRPEIKSTPEAEHLAIVAAWLRSDQRRLEEALEDTLRNSLPGDVAEIGEGEGVVSEIASVMASLDLNTLNAFGGGLYGVEFTAHGAARVEVETLDGGPVRQMRLFNLSGDVGVEIPGDVSDLREFLRGQTVQLLSWPPITATQVAPEDRGN